METSTLSSSSHLMVGLRVRPLLSNEEARGEVNAISIVPNSKSTCADNNNNNNSNINNNLYRDNFKIRIAIPEKSLLDSLSTHITSINNTQSAWKEEEEEQQKKEQKEKVKEASQTHSSPHAVPHANMQTRSDVVHAKELSYKEFSFDYCCGSTCKQNDVFNEMEIAKRIDSAFAGEAATVFCFGQTGSGKTFTLSGATVESLESASESEEKSCKDVKTNAKKANEIDRKSNKKERSTVSTKKEVKNEEVKQVYKNTEDGIAYQAIKYIAHKMHQINSNENCSNITTINSSVVEENVVNNEAGSSENRKELHSTLCEDSKNKPKCDVEKVIVKASYLELYNEHINDLLQCKDNLNVRWSSKAQSFYVENLLVVECTSEEDLRMVLREGDVNRKRTAHLLNRDSSRSHVITTFYIEHYYYNYVHANGKDENTSTEEYQLKNKRHIPTIKINDDKSDSNKKVNVLNNDESVDVLCSLYECYPTTFGKLTLVDLAGSERLKRTHSDGVDTKSINRSLFTLCTVIEQLATREEQRQKEKQQHENNTLSASNRKNEENTNKNLKHNASNNFVSYRSSLLTKLLYDSLHGSGHTLMIACVAPSTRDVEESLRTLYYAQRARRISCTATIRVNTEEQERVNMMQTIRALKAENALFRKVLNLTNVIDVISEELLYAKLNAMSELRCANHVQVLASNALTNESHSSESNKVKMIVPHKIKPSTAPTPITSSTQLPSLQLQPIKGLNNRTAMQAEFEQREMKRHAQRHYSLPTSTLSTKSPTPCAPLLQPLANAVRSNVKEVNCTAEDNATVFGTLSGLAKPRELKLNGECSLNRQHNVSDQKLQQAQRLLQESKNNAGVYSGNVTNKQAKGNTSSNDEVQTKSTLDLLNALPDRIVMIDSTVGKSKLPLNHYGFRPAPRQKENSQ